MCRLFGYVAAGPTSVASLLGEAAFDDFTALTAVHGDGWGMAWREPGDGIHCASSPEVATLDADYRRLGDRALGSAGLVHLRWATGGLPVREANTHPFCDGDYAFAHNGHISPIEDLAGMLTEESRSRLRGDTDSERYFRFLLQRIAESGDEERGVASALGTLLTTFPTSSLNALLLTPSRLFAVHINSTAPPPAKALRDLFESPHLIPARHETEYFAMDYRVTPDAVQVISSGLEEDGWTPVPEDTAAVVDLETRRITRLHPTDAAGDGPAGRPRGRPRRPVPTSGRRPRWR